VPASRFTIATRVGSASALNCAASAALASSGKGGAPGAQQGSIWTSIFIDVFQYSLY
jgi:hypothetical protein